jgi:hypothetical protein
MFQKSPEYWGRRNILTNTFSSYQATKTAQRKNEQKLSTVVRWVILYGSCCLLKSLDGTVIWREHQSSALMYLAWIIRKYHSIARQAFAVSPNSIPLHNCKAVHIYASAGNYKSGKNLQKRLPVPMVRTQLVGVKMWTKKCKLKQQTLKR